MLMARLLKNSIWMIATVLVIIMTFYFRPNSENFLGVVEPTDRILSSGVGGIVKKLHVRVGQVVRKGDLIMELEDGNLELAVNAASHLAQKLKVEKNLAGRISGANSTATGIDVEIEQLDNDFKLKQKQMNLLKIVAFDDGIVGDILVSVGQPVQAFEPLGTFYATKPLRVRGYLHEVTNVTLKVGDKVRVESATNYAKFSLGQVTAIGQRFTEIPIRLKPIYQQKDLIWSREVEVALPLDNSFLPFERVRILTEKLRAMSTASLIKREAQ